MIDFKRHHSLSQCWQPKLGIEGTDINMNSSLNTGGGWLYFLYESLKDDTSLANQSVLKVASGSGWLRGGDAWGFHVDPASGPRPFASQSSVVQWSHTAVSCHHEWSPAAIFFLPWVSVTANHKPKQILLPCLKKKKMMFSLGLGHEKESKSINCSCWYMFNK